MKTYICALVLYLLLVVCANAGHGPSNSEIKNAVVRNAMKDACNVTAFSTFETENLGTQTVPEIHTRIAFTLTSSEPRYSHVSTIWDIAVLRLVKSDPVMVNATAVSTRVNGQWVIAFENGESTSEIRDFPRSHYSKSVIQDSTEHKALLKSREEYFADARPKFSGVWGWPEPHTHRGDPKINSVTGGALYIRVVIPSGSELSGDAEVGFYDEFTNKPFVERTMPYCFSDKGFILSQFGQPPDFTKVGIPLSHEEWKLFITPEGNLFIQGGEFSRSLIPYDVTTARTERYLKQMASRKKLTGVWKGQGNISFDGAKFVRRDAGEVRMTFVINDTTNWVDEAKVILESPRKRVELPAELRIIGDKITVTEVRGESFGRWSTGNTWYITLDGDRMVVHSRDHMATATLSR